MLGSVWIHRDELLTECPKPRCPIFNNSTGVYLCEMLDDNECKCFAFDSSDGIHWSAIVMVIIIVGLAGYIVYKYRRDHKQKKKNEARSAVLPLHEILPQR